VQTHRKNGRGTDFSNGNKRKVPVEGEASAGGEPIRGHGPVHEAGGRVRGTHDQGRGQHAGGGVQARAGH